jgi:ribosomal protein S18 acetylase RimI-like enzyme
MAVTLDHAINTQQLADARILFKEYAVSLGVDLCFQDFESELRDLPGFYSEPQGCILLAFSDSELAGCVGLHPLSEEKVCEIKRMYVRPAFRGRGIGRKLAAQIIEEARKRKYEKMRLDTLPKLKEAQFLYHSLGFTEIKPYTFNPIEGALFMEKDL